MDESNLMLVFFDTFSHGIKPEAQIDPIRFSQPVKIGLIRIIPFGIAIESEIDSEARLGVTNPQNFNVKFFVHNSADSPAFEKIGEMEFDERNGVNSISFPSMPLASMLTINGCYNMLSLAVFGIISPQAHNAAKNSSNHLGNSAGQQLQLFGLNAQNIYNSNPLGIRAILGQGTSLNLGNIGSQMPSRSQNNQSATNMLMSLALAAGQHVSTEQGQIGASFAQAVEAVKEELQDDVGKTDQTLGLYEDGEIQEIDYEDVSSNEDLLFGMDEDGDFLTVESGEMNQEGEVAIQSVINGTTTTAIKKISTGFPDLDKRLMTERWRFLPKRIVSQGQLVSELKVLPNSYKTLFEVELERLCREEKDFSATNRTTNIDIVPATKEEDKSEYVGNTEEGGCAIEDIPDSADRLINLVSTYGESNLYSEWVEQMEDLPKTLAPGFAYLTYADKDTADYVLESLITWVKVGLNMDAALRQSENMYILRHLKAGITMAGLMCSLDENIADRVLSCEPSGFNVQHSLIDLLGSAVIATPLKLHIICALDHSTRLKIGLDRFITLSRPIINSNNNPQTPYQRFIYFMLQSNTARVNMASERLMNKVHLYEVLFTFESIIMRLRDDKLDADEVLKMKIEANILLREIIRFFIHAKELIANPRRSMPCSKLFDDSLHRPHNSYPNLLSMMHSTNMLTSIDWILGQSVSVPKDTVDQVEVQSKGLIDKALRLIWEFAQRHESLVYLMSGAGKTMNVILRRLFALNPDNATGDCGPDGAVYQQHWLTLGLELAYKLEALRFIDELLAWSTHNGGLQGLARQQDLLEDAQLAGILLGLAKLTGERRGAAWIAQVITMDDNLAPILPIFEALETKTLAEDRGDSDTKMDLYQPSIANSTSSDTTRVPLPHSICLHYLPNLLTAIVRHADHAGYLGKYGSRLAALGKDGTTSPFIEASEWLQPIRELPASDCISDCVEQMKAACAEMDAANIPPGLITVLRLLRLHLVVPGSDGSSTGSGNRPHYLPDTEIDGGHDMYSLPERHCVDYVKYKYAITEFYRCEGLTVLNKLLQQISDHHQLSWQCGIEAIDNRYPFLLCIAEPATAIVRAVTQRLMQSRGNQFKDTTGLLPLFSCYTIFCSKLYFGQQISSTRYQGQLENIRHAIIDTVLTYTQSQLPDEENEKALEKSLWTCMTKELLNFTLSAPYAFAGGLSLFLELLPLPLPILTMVPLTDEETVQVKSARTLWSAHILCVRQELKKVVHTIGCSSNHTLVALVSRLVNLVSALGSGTALLLAQNCLETLTEVWERVHRDMIEHNEHVESLRAAEANDNTEDGGSSKDNISKSGDDGNNKEGASGPSSSLSSGVNQILLRNDSLLGIDAKTKLYPDSLEMTRLWCMLKLILTVPACKHAFLKLIGQTPQPKSVDCDQSLETAFFKIVSELLEASKENHTVAQENMIGCLQLLLDGRVVMLSSVHDIVSIDSDDDDVSSDEPVLRVLSHQELMNGLPPRGQCLVLVGWLARHCVSPDQDMATIPGALRPLVALAGHDYGFRILLEVLDQQQGMLLTLIKRVNETFSADNPDCQVTLLTALSLLQALVVKPDTATEHPDMYRLPPRTLNVSDAYVRQVLQWKGDKEANSTHPVSELHGLLKIVSEEEESLQILRDGMESLIELLSMNDLIVGHTEGHEGTAEAMPDPQSVESIFECRGVWQIVPLSAQGAQESRLGQEWLGPVQVSPVDKEPPELARCDLENLAYVCCNGFNLHEELARGRQQDDEAIRHKRRRRGNDAIIHTSGRSSKKFVAPMRGRGFGVRSSNSGSNANNDRHDSFRSRPPNTSRPPSMHVDDFQKLQKDEKLDEEIMVRERNLRNLRGGRSGVRTVNQGSRMTSSSTDQSKMPPPSSSRSRQLK